MRKCTALLLAAILFATNAGCSRHEAPGVTTEPSAYPSVSVEETTVETVTETTVADTEAPAIVAPTPSEDALVPVYVYIPDLPVELRYAGVNNFTGTIIYDFSDCYLRYGTIKKLMYAQELLAQRGLSLKIWDGFRPVSAQFVLWQVCPDPQYVANPNTGYSSHSRGNTVDVTLVDASGKELRMPTEFDDFSALADRNYADCDPEARENAEILESVMTQAGFTGYFGEWWHFTDTQDYPVEQKFTPIAWQVFKPQCETYITLRQWPDVEAPEITRIPVGERFVVCAYCGDFSYVLYRGVYGYVLSSYTSPVT